MKWKACVELLKTCNKYTYTVKTLVLKLTPAGVNTGSISNSVNLTSFWCYFNTFWCFSSPVGVISTPKSVEITPKWC